MQPSVQDRFSERFVGLLSPDEIMITDMRGSMLRLLSDRSLGKPDSFRDEDSEQFKQTVQMRTDDLLGKDLRNHILFADDPEAATKSELVEEALFWNIKSKKPLEPEVSAAIRGIYDRFRKMPISAHKLMYPLHMVGYLLGHSTRVAIYSALLAQEARALGKDIDPVTAAQCGFVHDIGKLQLGQKELVRKPGMWSDEMRQKIKWHPIFGAAAFDQLREMDDGKHFPTEKGKYQNMVEVILKHHVRPDHDKKLSYPYWINPLELNGLIQTVSIADAFDAMTSRVHRAGTKEVKKRVTRAYNEMEIHKGTQFDPDLTDMFNSEHPMPHFYETAYLDVA